MNASLSKLKSCFPLGTALRFAERLAIVILFAFPGALSAQQLIPIALKDPQPVFKNINADNGLPSSETYDIFQDKEGYIWIATDRGVARYDGYRFRIFTKKDGLADNVIFYIREDPKGRIWFVSFSGLLSYFEDGKIHNYQYNGKLRKLIAGLTPTYKELLFDGQGNMYYSIGTAGTIKMAPDGTFTDVGLKRRGVQLLDIGGGQWLGSIGEPTVAEYAALKGKVPEISYLTVFKKTGGKLTKMKAYAANASRIATLNSGGRSFMALDDNVADIRDGRPLLDDIGVVSIKFFDDCLFAGIYKGGVRCENLLLPPGDPGRTVYYLNGYSVTCTLKDREGGYWFTTLDKGVFYTPDLRVLSFTVLENLPANSIVGIAGIRDRVIATYANGAVQLTRPNWRTDFDKGSYNIRIAATAAKFFIVSNALYRTKITDDIFFINGSSDMFASQQHVIMSRHSLFRVYENGLKDSLLNHIDKRATFQVVGETGSGKIYAGSLYGLFRIRDMQLFSVNPGNPLFSERVTDIDWNAAYGTVIATRGKGLYFMDDNERLTREIDVAQGLISSQVSCIFIDEDNYLYVGTSKGMNIIHLEPGGGFSIRSVTAQHGLCSNEITAIYAYNGKVWVGTTNGINVLNRDNGTIRPHGTIAAEYIMADDQYYDHSNFPTHFRHTTEFIKIGLRTDNFRGSSQHEFMYQLRKDGQWIKTDRPELVINNPVNDDYRIAIRFRDDSGTWSKPFAVAVFTVDTPYYKEWYFISLIALGLLLLIYWLFRIVVKRIKSRHYYETRINKLEQKALSAQMNPHFIFNSLNSIQSFLMYEENEKAERYLLKFSSLIRQTLANSREHYITMEQELSILQNYLELEQMRFKDRFTFEIRCELTSQQLQLYIPPMLIQPYVENAVLHGVSSLKTGGKIAIDFVISETDKLLVIIDDNGSGRVAGTKKKGQRSYGTTITQERLDILKKQFGVEFKVNIIDKRDETGALGTRIELNVQMIHEYLNEENQPAEPK